ncbi:MAG: asparaginase [Elsteraceae bacterium]
MRNPLFDIEITRGPLVESRHQVSAVVVDAQGAILAAWGDPERLTYPRSANKPLQALPLIETGAADRFNLTDRQIAFACASHRGEVFHVEAARDWLAQIGLDVTALECGAHMPSDEAHANQMIRAGEIPTALHNNCSGKHSGMLTHAVHCGDAPKGYVGIDHPTQRRVTRAVMEMCDVSGAPPHGVDGCGIPTFAIPLRNLALGMARLVDTGGLPTDRAKAAARVVAGMAAAPEMVSGTNEFVTRAMEIAGEKAVVKTGAEGVFTGALRRKGLGFALKAEDGAGRAAELAAAALLKRFADLDDAQITALDRFLEPRIFNRAGLEVGRMRPHFQETASF